MGFGRVFGTEEAKPKLGQSVGRCFSAGALKRNSTDRRILNKGFTSCLPLAVQTWAFAYENELFGHAVSGSPMNGRRDTDDQRN